jgi:hypothetical protein
MDGYYPLDRVKPSLSEGMVRMGMFKLSLK